MPHWDELTESEDPAVDLLDFFGYTYVPYEILDRERESSRDAVLVTRLVQVNKESQYVPGTTYVDSYWGSPYSRGGYYGHYSSSYAVVHDPGYVIENTIVQLETNIYDTETEALIFAAASETLNPDSVSDAIQKFAKTMVGELMEQGLIK